MESILHKYILGYFNESELRNKESSTRLETNLVQSLIFNLCKGFILTNIGKMILQV